MKGLLADVNVQGHVLYLRHLLEMLDLWTVLAELKLSIATFRDLNIPQDLDDRTLWILSQEQGWVLFTENRNRDGPDSLTATLTDSWRMGCLPVVTLSNKRRFEHSREYAERVANDVAELMFGVFHGQYRDRDRIYVPFVAN